MQQVERVGVTAGQRLESREVDAARERRECAQQPLLRLAEQLVRRRDAGAQGALAGVLGTLPPGGQVEGAVQALAHRPHRHHRDLSGGQLDAEGQPVQPAQHLHEVGGVPGLEVVVVGAPPGVLDEGADAGMAAQRVEVGDLARHR